ncbi:hypothetical protein GCM10009122_24520 [Fulvivirga kasyanovii]
MAPIKPMGTRRPEEIKKTMAPGLVLPVLININPIMLNTTTIPKKYGINGYSGSMEVIKASIQWIANPKII